MAESNSFQLRLTPGELYYAAGLLGFEKISLMGQPFAGWTPEKIQAQTQRGKQILEERGWLRTVSTGEMEMDETLAGLLQLVAKPNFMVEVSTLTRQSKGSTSAVYPIPGGCLVFSLDGPDYLFHLYPASVYDPFLPLRQAGIRQQPGSEERLAPISEQAFWGIVRKSFVDQLPAEQIRKAYPNNIEWSDACLPRLEFITRLVLQCWENGALRVAGTRVFAGNASELWQVAPGEATSTLEFLPVSAGQVFKTNFFGQP